MMVRLADVIPRQWEAILIAKRSFWQANTYSLSWQPK